VVRHQTLRREQKRQESLVDLNREALTRLQNRWIDFTDDGREFENDAHRYASDLNIFGRGSLFQYLQRTSTLWGRQALAHLLAGFEPQGQLSDRQAAVVELSRQLDWRLAILEALFLMREEDIVIFALIGTHSHRYG
jgi:hypothetical protein